jgi:hypothetical protein
VYGLYVINDPGNFAHLGSIGGARDRSMSQYLTEQTPHSVLLYFFPNHTISFF